ncbi:MAG: HAMP domain-containing sensor histidine kinase [Bacteroidota bacterium]
MKIQTKTTILFTVLTATIFLILNITVYVFIDSLSHTDFNKRLELRARISSKYRFEQGEVSTEAFREIQKQYLDKLPEEQAYVVQVDSVTGKPLSTTAKELPASFIKNIVANDGKTAYYQSRFRHFAGLLYKDETGYYLVIKSATNQYGADLMRHLLVIKLITLVCAVVLIYSVGLVFARKTFKPIRDIISRVQEINEVNLHLRLPEKDGSDEIAELTRTFNQMLGRLETAFEIQNNFISNASHELRTPLTAIVGEADYALNKVRTAEAYQQSLQQILLQAEKLQELTRGLLSLAQTGFDGERLRWEIIRTDQLLFDVKANCDAILPGNKLHVNLDALPADEAGISIKGNYDLLKIAIGNIVMNACKYSDNKVVSMQLLLEKNKAFVIITDTGIGIPQKELKHIFDPFFRASNTQDYHGHGIGMPLSNNIISLHKGTINVRSAENAGTVVTITLPLV